MCKSEGRLTYLSPLRQQPQCTATISKQPQLLSTYVYLHKWQVSKASHLAQFALVHNFSRPNTFELRIKKREANFSGKLYSILFGVLQGLAIIDLCSEGTWMDTSLTRHCEECSLCDSEVGTPAFTASLAVQSTLTLLYITNAIAQRLHFSCTNRILTCTNKLEYKKLASFSRKKGCPNYKFYGISINMKVLTFVKDENMRFLKPLLT